MRKYLRTKTGKTTGAALAGESRSRNQHTYFSSNDKLVTEAV